MKINLDRPITDYRGVALSDKNGNPLNMAEQLCSDIYMLTQLGGAPIDATKKYQLHKLMQKISSHPGDVEITTEEGSLLKDAAAGIYSVGAYGRIVDAIENNH